MENTKKKTVWIAELYRFGYDLVVVEETKDKARRAMVKEYNRAYKHYNAGARPTSEEIENRNCDIRLYETTIGNVLWT